MIAPLQLKPAAFLTDTVAALYTVPTSLLQVEMREIRLCNTDTVTRTVTVNMVPSGGSVADSNLALKTYRLQAGETKTLNFSTVLMPGDSVQGFADLTSKVTVQISGLAWS